MIRAFQRFSYDQDDQEIFSVSPTIKRIEFFSVSHTIKRIGDLQCSSYYQEDRRFSVFLLLSRGSVIFSVSPTIKRIRRFSVSPTIKRIKDFHSVSPTIKRIGDLSGLLLL